MSSDPRRLGGLDHLQAAVLVPCAVAVCAGLGGFFVTRVVADAWSRAPRPLGEHFDAATVIVALLCVALFVVCLRAYLRVRRRGAAYGEVLVRVVRAVPYLMLVSAVAGAVLGARAARAAALREDGLARTACEQVLGEGSAEIEACLVVAVRCGRARERRCDLHENADVACVREALGPKAR